MDLVERKDAILCLDDDIYIEGKENAEAVVDYVNRVRKRLNKLPAHEKDEWCHDCKEYDQQKHCCPRWNRVIRETVKELKSEQSDFDITVKIDKAYDDGYKTGYLQGRYDWGDLDG